MNFGVRLINGGKVSHNWAELKVLINKEFHTYYKDILSIIRALGVSSEFCNEIEQIRSKYDIQPMSQEKWYELAVKNPQWFDEVFNNTHACTSKLIDKYRLDSRIDYLVNHLVLFNYAVPEEKIIIDEVIGRPIKLRWRSAFQITVLNPISKTRLIEYINKNWNDYYQSIQNLPSPKVLNINERDMRITELKDNSDMTYPEIVEEIINEFKLENLHGEINESSVKMAYHRTKEKINKFFRM